MRTFLFLLAVGTAFTSCEKQLSTPSHSNELSNHVAVEAQKEQVWNLGWKTEATSVGKEFDEKTQTVTLIYSVKGSFSGPWSKVTDGANDKDGIKYDAKLFITDQNGNFIAPAQISWNNIITGDATISFTVSEKAFIGYKGKLLVAGDLRFYKNSIDVYTKLRGVIEKFISSAKDEL